MSSSSAAESTDQTSCKFDMDWLLKCTDPTCSTHIRVSSVVLSTGSKIFEKTFNVGTKEDTSLVYARNRSPVKVQLPYDRPSALLAICYIMHRRDDKVDVLHGMKPERVMRIAELGVTYHCMATLQPAMQTWLEGNDWHLSECGTGECLLTAAFLSRHEGAFRKLSREVLLHSTQSISISSDAPGVVHRIKPVLGLRGYALQSVIRADLFQLHSTPAALLFSSRSQVSSSGRSCCVLISERANARHIPVRLPVHGRKWLWQTTFGSSRTATSFRLPYCRRAPLPMLLKASRTWPTTIA
jgi:hypothetical protein